MIPDDKWMAVERKHEREMAEIEAGQRIADRQHKRFVMEQRTKRIGIIASVLAVVAVILGITYAAWDGSNKQREAEERVITECIESGGTWTQLGGGGSSNKTCVYLKESGQ